MPILDLSIDTLLTTTHSVRKRLGLDYASGLELYTGCTVAWPGK